MKLDFSFKKESGAGSVFLKREDLIAYFPNDTSYYFGVFKINAFDEPTKIIDSFIDWNWKTINLKKYSAEFNKKNKIAIGKDVLELTYNIPQFLDLDFRKLYDFNDQERYYHIHEEPILCVECQHAEKRYWLAIDGRIKLINQWVEKHYPYDESRNDRKSAFVYRLGEISGNTRIGFGYTKQDALAALKNKITNSTFKSMKDLLYFRLKQLKHEDRIKAGYPWFFHAWTRDELMSMSKLNSTSRKKIIKSYLKALQKDGLLPNRLPHSDLGSADSTGLLAFRIRQNLDLFSNEEKKEILNFFQKAIKRLDKNFNKDGLIYSRPKETWMDTIGREGFNIEIQALYANILALLKELKAASDLDVWIKNFRKKWTAIDNLEEIDARPNIFLAYYYYPELFEKKVWKEKFDIVLRECWLDWGGLSTISKNSWKFHDTDNGVLDSAYHNGDSWYWINNIAAMAMLDFPKLKKTAKKIYEASTKECMTQGLLGCPAEISSAKARESRGCWYQAWSVTTLLELHDKIESFK